MPNRDGTCLLLDPDYVLRVEGSSVSFDVSLAEEEGKGFPNILAFQDGRLDVTIVGKNPVYEASVVLTGVAIVRDGHDGSERELPIQDDVQLVLDVKDMEASDIPMEKDGHFDLRGTFLSLLHDAVPPNYSAVPLTRVETKDYVLMSEEEYERSKRKESPFDALDAFFDEEK